MNETECSNCTFHVIYWDEIDGEFYHDGCMCTIDKEEHLHNCSDFDDEFKGCPYFQEE